MNNTTIKSRLHAIARLAMQPISPWTLAVFRIAFGSIMVIEVYRYFDTRWIERYFVAPDMLFPYVGFQWVDQWFGRDIEVLFALLGIAAVGIAVGIAYRACMLFFAIGFGYIFLLDSTRYLNHFYFVVLLSFLMLFIPANRVLSLDRFFFQHKQNYPSTMDRWHLWILRFMVGIPYFYGGIAKLTPDWLRGHPLTGWLIPSSDLPVIGSFLVKPTMGLFMSYAGLVFDLVIVPMLLWRKTRLLALVLLLIFNFSNSVLFDIGIFPWLMMAATIVFYPADTLEKLWSTLRKKTVVVVNHPVPIALSTKNRVVLVCVSVFVLWQIVFPFRHFLYPGYVHWTREGGQFAWHMKLNDKRGYVILHVKDPKTGISQDVDPRSMLLDHQYRTIFSRPTVLLQFVHHLTDRFVQEKGYKPEIYADAMLSLNGRPMQRYIKPDVNLVSKNVTVWHKDWLLPFDNSHPPITTIPGK